ncbi:MAG: hypothetical protein ACKN9R_03405, partial [Candidatus Limnocylindrus sp.]
MSAERKTAMADFGKLADKRAHLLTEARDLAVAAGEKGAALEGEDKARFEALVAEAGTIAEALRAEKTASEARKAADEARAEFASIVAPTAAPAAKSDSDRLRAIGKAGGVEKFEYRDIKTDSG